MIGVFTLVYVMKAYIQIIILRVYTPIIVKRVCVHPN